MSVTELEDVAWDLEPLVDGQGTEGADRQLADADERAAAFAERYAGRVAEKLGMRPGRDRLHPVTRRRLRVMELRVSPPAAGRCSPGR